MRDYRGKCKATGEWLFGFLVDERHIGNWVEASPVYPETVGQYSGIFTKDEVEDGDTLCTFIYEGDIVEPVLLGGTHYGFSWGRQVVVFDRGAFCLKNRRGEITPMCNYAANVKFKVWGNIHDNPVPWEVDA